MTSLGFTAFAEYRVGGVARPEINLSDGWQVALASAQAALAEGPPAENLEWRSIQVPGEAMMQGIALLPDTPFCYRLTLDIPSDYSGHRILLCFDGVYTEATVYIDGTAIGHHRGGFTPWAVDLTGHVKPGESSTLLLEVVDRRNDVSFASGYAKHLIAGILRDVRLRAEPGERVDDWRAITTVASDRNQATLDLAFTLHLKNAAKLEVSLVDQEGHAVPITPSVQELAPGATHAAWKITVDNPRLWTAETPRLYRMTATVSSQGTLRQSFTQRIGLRQVEVDGDRLLVNGRPVKLRGACRHDIHPLLGRVSTPEYELRDVKLAKEANLNFIRTSHYPPTRHFLELCDEYGIYVEDETAVCFINTWRRPPYRELKQSGPEFREQMLGQVRAMERDGRNHPSVLFWSIGNESVYDDNFQASYDYLKAVDPTRPVIFSYPGTVPSDRRAYDLMSLHYPDVDHNGLADNYNAGKTEGWRFPGYPTLFDEWAHIPCYALAELREDPNIRNFWGPSIDLMWNAVEAEPGALGGAIWGMIDETFALPPDLPHKGISWALPANLESDFAGPEVGYGEWGIIDVWRRKKPEFWHVKKAYSPVRLHVDQVARDANNGDWLIPFENRHDHLDLTGFEIQWHDGDAVRSIPLPTVQPHTSGTVRLPATIGPGNAGVRLSVVRGGRSVIDEEILRVGTTETPATQPSPSAKAASDRLTWVDMDTEWVLQGTDLTVRFDRESGLLLDATYLGRKVLGAGPRLTFRSTDASKKGPYPAYPEKAVGWRLTSWRKSIQAGTATVEIEGMVADDHPVSLELAISADGTLRCAYRTRAWENQVVREVGLLFDLPTDAHALRWSRDTYWTAYPPDHPGRPDGVELLRAEDRAAYRHEPEQPWWHDTHDFYLFGEKANLERPQLTRVARSSHTRLRNLALLDKVGKPLVSVRGDGTIAARLSADADGVLCLRLLNHWAYPSLMWGNHSPQIQLPATIAGEFEMAFARGE